MNILLLMTSYFFVHVSGDCYLHTLRGSNNRLNEKSANRNNGNRLFDSQNNNRGGYNVGDLNSNAFNAGDVGNGGNTHFGNALDKGQYSMMFFEGSDLVVEWTNQHGCGGNEKDNPHKLNCNLVLQMGCQTGDHQDLNNVYQLKMDLKNGRNTNTPNTATSMDDAIKTRPAANDAGGYGRHENEGWYYACSKTPRNKGLFLADQNVKGNVATYTRQNPNANRRGLECAEERDYFPYWNPTPWMDVAVLTDNPDEDCKSRFNFQGESQNVKEKWACVEKTAPQGQTDDCFEFMHNMTKCDENPSCKSQSFTHGIKAPRCEQAPWTRANSLGNGATGRPTTITWTLPKLEPGEIGKYTNIATLAGGGKLAKCVLRIRYNISTDDYDPANTNASHNKNLQKKDKDGNPTPVVSPVTQNPTVDVGLASLQGLRLAINTNQFGRTFQDRSHTWYIMSRGAGMETSKIQNLIVRGKRGNIVQTFPAVEYDFSPKNLEVKTTDFVHIQWTGSNTHNNGNPAGDGQAGDAGEGTGGTDRTNILSAFGGSRSYPVPFASSNAGLKQTFKEANLFENVECWAPKDAPTTTDSVTWNNNDFASIPSVNCALKLGSSNYYNTKAELTTKADLSVLLNNAPASLAKGIVIKGKTPGKYNYMCSRNNNFTNRSQKGSIVVV